jgi:threonine dehydratase
VVGVAVHRVHAGQRAAPEDRGDLELLDALPEVGTVVVPTGGGGLLTGIAVAVKSARPESVVVGVEIAAAPVYVRSLEEGRPVEVPAAQTVADGINVTVPSVLVFALPWSPWTTPRPRRR